MNYDSDLQLDERDAAVEVFRRQKALAEHCLHQVSDAQFFRRPAPHLNSLAILVQHLTGNMESRWSDFGLMMRGVADGEKAHRDRDAELRDPAVSATIRAELMERWQRGWALVFDVLTSFTREDLDRTVRIRGATHSVHLAVLRQIDHYGHHVGQIAFISRHLAGAEEWDFFTIPPGESKSYNRMVRKKNDHDA